MIRVLLTILFFLILKAVPAQKERELFADANKLYQEEKYDEAINIYKQLESQQLVSDDLFYNLGTAYYKMNQVAPAIYYLEKALMVNPGNEDAEHNLTFAKRMAIDNIESLPKTIGERFSEGFIQKISYNAWAWIGVVLAFIFAGLFLWYHFSFDSSRKRLFFVSSFVSAALALTAILFAYSNYEYVKNNRYAIVFAQQVNVKNAPAVSGDLTFELHEGTKVKLLETVDNWNKIKLADGKIGWLQVEDIKALN